MKAGRDKWGIFFGIFPNQQTFMIRKRRGVRLELPHTSLESNSTKKDDRVSYVHETVGFWVCSRHRCKLATNIKKKTVTALEKKIPRKWNVVVGLVNEERREFGLCFFDCFSVATVSYWEAIKKYSPFFRLLTHIISRVYNNSKVVCSWMGKIDEERGRVFMRPQCFLEVAEKKK